jgi:hypothetical protein
MATFTLTHMNIKGFELFQDSETFLNSLNDFSMIPPNWTTNIQDNHQISDYDDLKLNYSVDLTKAQLSLFNVSKPIFSIG